MFKKLLMKYVKIFSNAIHVKFFSNEVFTTTRDGTGQDYLDPTGKFQKLRRLTGRSTGF